MAAANYYPCDVCGRKAFYDAEVPWDAFAGSVRALCAACTKGHDLVIVQLEAAS